MTIRITTTRAAVALALALAYVGLVARDSRGSRSRTSADHGGPANAAGADAAAAGVDERPWRGAQGRATHGIEDQTSLERKAFADGKVQMDTISGDIRVVREKVDETNVRLGSITQELESIRQAIPEPGAFQQIPLPNDAGAAPGATPGRRAVHGGDRPANRESRRSAAAAVSTRRGPTTPRVTIRSRCRDSRAICGLSRRASGRTKHSFTSASRLRGKRRTWTPLPLTIASSRTIRDRRPCRRHITSAGWRSSVWESRRGRESRTKR